MSTKSSCYVHCTVRGGDTSDWIYLWHMSLILFLSASSIKYAIVLAAFVFHVNLLLQRKKVYLSIFWACILLLWNDPKLWTSNTGPNLDADIYLLSSKNTIFFVNDVENFALRTFSFFCRVCSTRIYFVMRFRFFTFEPIMISASGHNLHDW